MKSIDPDASAPPEHAVHGPCDADGQPLNPAREHANIHRLDEEMNVIPLHRELQNAQAAARRARQPAADGREELLGAERREPMASPQRHVYGMASVVRGSRAMRYAGLSTRRLATGAVALSAPRPRVKLQLEGTLPHDLTEAVNQIASLKSRA